MARFFQVALFAVLLAVGFPGRLVAQLPATRLDGLHPVGTQVGTTVEVTLSGADLDDVSELIFSHQGIKAKAKLAEPTPFDEQPQRIENQFVVEVASNVPPGAYEVRCRGKYGLSGPRRFLITRDPVVLESEPNNDAESATLLEAVPGVVFGQLNGTADVDWIRFTAQAGQRVMVQAYANRVDSTAVPVLALHHANGERLAESRKTAAGDALIDTKLASGGEYLLRVHEELFLGGTHLVYGVRIGMAPVIDCIFPPAGQPGSNDEYTVYGRNLPGGQPAGMTRYGQTLEQLKVRIPIPSDIDGKLQFSEALSPHQAGLDGVEYRVSTAEGHSNPVLLTVATAPKAFEQADNDSPQKAQPLKIPCEVMGQFYPQRDTDWFTFDAKAGEVYWLEIYSHRLGLSTDATMLIQRVEPPKGEAGSDGAAPQETVRQIAWVDDVNQRDGGFEFDQRTHDPYYEFTAPADGTYRVMLRESHSSVVSDPQLMYRFAIRQAQPDFRLAAVPMDSNGAIFLRQGGREAVNVTVFRQDGYQGEIEVTVAGLPTGVTASPLTIGPGCNRATLVLNAATDAAATEGQLEIVGKAKVGEQMVTRVARTGHPLAAVPFAQPTNRNQPSVPSKLTSSLPVVVTGEEKARVVLSLPQADKPIETSRGGIVKVKCAVTRDGDAGGNVIAYPFGGPSTMQIRTTNIGGNKEGEAELRFPADMPPGTYSICLVATVQGMKYVRNPEAVEAAKQRQERINSILAEAKQATQKATQDVQQAQNGLNQANTQLTQAQSALTAAQQAQKTAAANAKTAAEEMAALQKQVAEKPEDAALKQQLTAAQQKAATQKQQADAAATAVTAAMKKVAETTTAQTAATDAKKAADEALAKAQAFEREATQEKSRTDTKVRTLEQAARPRNVNHLVYSQPVTIQVDDYPFDLAALPKTTVKQGEKATIPVKITRLYGLDQTVTGQIRLPSGVSGLQFQNISIPNGKQDATINITAQANATPGEHEVTLSLAVTFNGQRLTFEQPVTVVVQEVAKPQ